MSRSKLQLAWILASLLLVMGPPLARADGPQTGTIDGHVTDAQGSPLPGVTVNLSGPQVTRTAITDQDGVFRFALLQAGEYTVGATLEGLGSAELALTLESGVRRGVELQLQAASAELITVVSEAPLVSRYEIGSTSSLESDVAENLSFRSRLYNSTVRMLPGVVNVTGAPGVSDEDAAPSINGGTQGEVAAFVEGVDTSITRRGGELRFAIPTTAVADTRVEAAGFGAEYGRAISGVINSTIKTGTNQFHGEGLYVGQNLKWRSAYEELDIERPDDQINSYELNLGGPLYRDRAWFFAAYASISSNELDELPSGDVIDTSREYTPSILKLNFQPGERHQIALTGIDSPSEAIFVPVQNIGDIYGLTNSINDQTLYTGTWSFAVTDSTFLEVKGSSRREDTIRGLLYSHDVDPSVPDSPRGNNNRYLDLGSGIRYNAAGTPLGNGFNKFPRDQGNASLTKYFGKHEIKFGVDYQDVAFDNLTDIGEEYRGRGYDPSSPNGYVPATVSVPGVCGPPLPANQRCGPSNKRVFTPPGAPGGVVSSPGEIFAGFAQDRVDVGDRWTFTYGVRIDDQTVENDVGESVISYTKPAPRLSAVYDVQANGKFLARASAGRYYRVVSQDIATREFARLSSGANEYDQFAWNPATQRYDIFQQHVAPINTAEIPDLDPMYKDEISAGLDWQFRPEWVFGVQAVWSEMGDLFWSTDQFDAAGQVVTDVRNWDGGFRKYKGITFELNRAFRNGWAVRGNATLAKAEGNVDFNTDDDDLFEALGGVEVGTGRTDATIVNRAGRNSWDRESYANLVGIKRWTLGKHSIGAGAYYFYRAGQHWGLRPATTVRSPISGQTINTSTYAEPRDDNQLEDTWNINLTADWTFPISGKVRGKLGAELANATDEQEVVVIVLASGRPAPGIIAYQVPREFRLNVGISF